MAGAALSSMVVFVTLVSSPLDIGVKALATMPLKSVKKGVGEIDINVHFADVDFIPGDYVYADEDGVIISSRALL